MGTLVVGLGGPGRKNTSMPPPGDDSPKPAMKEGTDNGAGKKVSVADAHKVGADQHCSQCQHYMGASGECEKVDGVWDPEDACVKYFTPASGGDEESPEEDASESPEQEAAEDQGNSGPVR